MKKKTTKSKIILNNFVQRRINIKIAVRVSALLGFLIVGGTGIVQQVYAAQSVAEYCNQYTDSDDKNACKDGIRGTDCSAYLSIFSFDSSLAQRTNMICKQATKDRIAGVVSTESNSSGTKSPSPTPTPVTTPGSTPSPSATPKPTSSPVSTPTEAPTDTSSEDNTAANQEKLNQAKDLSQYIDILHGMVKKADEALGNISTNSDVIDQPDNNLGSYVNGANKQQPIITLNPGTGNSPAILFFNGGGWHANDGMGENVAGTVDRTTSMYDNTGAERAGDRGYAMYDVTYRLGSSGVYYIYEDVMRGIQHMRNNAAAYGIDPNRIIIWGDSAGGSLVMRAAASGKSGAKVAVGWSAPTNAYTGLFRSIASLAIGIDHSTCAPTDIAGLANFADKFNGGDGNVAEYGQGLSSNDFSALGLGMTGSTSGGINPLSLLTEGLVAGRYLLSAAADLEPITSKIKNQDFGGLAGSTINLASKTFSECIENFNAMSPALFASPDSPPSFLAEFENDGLVGPDQALGMRDKLRQLGIQAEAKILPGSDDCLRSAPDIFGTGCHLGYYKDFVTPTLDFIDSVINNDWEPVGGGVDAITGGGSSGSPSIDSGGGSGGGSSKTKQKNAQCATIGSVYVSDSKNPQGGACKSVVCELFQSICENNFVSGKLNS